MFWHLLRDPVRHLERVRLADLAVMLLSLYASSEAVAWRFDLSWWLTRHWQMLAGR